MGFSFIFCAQNNYLTHRRIKYDSATNLNTHPTNKPLCTYQPQETQTNVTSTAVPYGVYLNSTEFLSGAAAQVAYTYKMLGGDVLDIELTEQNIYTAYELATLEYSYIINNHQAINVLSDFLGATTGTFDHKGTLESGELSSSLSGTHVALKFPTFNFSYAARVSDGLVTRGSNG